LASPDLSTARPAPFAGGDHPHPLSVARTSARPRSSATTGGRIDVDAESMWPAGSCLEFWAAVRFIGSQQVCVQRIAASEVRQVERDDGAIWAT
jgi:hypothetical protein